MPAGHVVCPGFIDLHSHAGLTILGEPHHDPKVRQGVTTELVGIDGISHAPFKTQEELHRYIWLDSGLNGYPPMPADWLTVAELLSKYDNSVAINIAYILGNAPVRIWGVGWNDRPATAAEMEDMKAVIREAMEEGAWGLSTGLDYPPGSYADTTELAELSAVTASLGGFYHTHTRASLRSQGLLAPWEEALEIGRRSGCPIHLTHYRQSAQGSGSHLDYLGLVERGRDEGMDVTFDCYTYPYSGTTVTIGLPHWAKDGGPERLMAALQDADDRARMKREVLPERLEGNWLTNFTQPQNKQYEGRLITDIGEMRGQDPADALFDLLLEENLGISTVGLGHQPPDIAGLRLPSLRHDCQRCHSLRRISQSPYLRVLPHCSRRIRAGREAPQAARSHPQDDVLPGPTVGPARPGPVARRLQGRHSGFQPGYGQDSRHPGRPQALSRGNRVRNSQRPGGH